MLCDTAANEDEVGGGGGGGGGGMKGGRLKGGGRPRNGDRAAAAAAAAACAPPPPPASGSLNRSKSGSDGTPFEGEELRRGKGQIESGRNHLHSERGNSLIVVVLGRETAHEVAVALDRRAWGPATRRPRHRRCKRGWGRRWQGGGRHHGRNRSGKVHGRGEGGRCRCRRRR